MNKYFKTFILFALSVVEGFCYCNNLTKERLATRDENGNMVLDPSGIPYPQLLMKFPPFIDEPSAINPFFISFDPKTEYIKQEVNIDNKTIIKPFPRLERTDKRTLIRLPYINSYGFANNSFKEELALLILTPEMLEKVLPEEIKKELSLKLNIQPQDLINKLKAVDTIFNAVILGNSLSHYMQLTPGPQNSTYNIIYHFWAILWHNPNSIKDSQNPYQFNMRTLKDFNDQVDMGLFLPQGIINLNSPQNSIAFNKLDTQDVYFHQALSPNDARFKIDMGKQLSSFWAVALSPNKQHINVTYFLIANSQLTKQSIDTMLLSSNNISDLETYFSHLKIKSQLSDEDFNTAKEWISTIVKAITETKIVPATQPTKIDLETAKASLSCLVSTLNSLSSR